MSGAFLVFALGSSTFWVLNKEFIPSEDQSRFNIRLKTPDRGIEALINLMRLFTVAHHRLCLNSPGSGMRVKPAILPDRRRVASDITDRSVRLIVARR